MPTSFLKKSHDFSKIAFRRVSDWLDHSLRRNPLVAVCAFAMTGITYLDGQNPAIGVAAVLLLTALFGMALRKQRTLLPIAVASLLGWIAFAWLHAANLRTIHSFPLADALHTEDGIEIEGAGWIASRTLSGKRSTSGTLELTSLELGGKTIPCRHRVPVWFQKPDLEIEYGDTIQFSGLLRPLESAVAPGGFDPKAFYFRQSGSLARVEIRAGDSLAVQEEKNGSSLIAFSQRLRDRMEEALAVGLSEKDESYARLIAAMSLGARENSPEELEDLFRRSGTMHIFAVSGLHVGIVAGLLMAVALFFRLPKRYAVFVVIPLVLFYAILTGLRPSAVRAAIMLCILLAAFAFKERPRLVNSLALAGLLILWFDTQQLFLPGFQLSFAVLLCIGLFAEPVRKFFAKPWLSDPYIPKTLLQPAQRWRDHAVTVSTALLALSVVSWMGSLGLLTWHFQSFSPVGVLANLFLVPLAGVIVTFAAAALASFGLKMLWLTSLLNKLTVGVAVVLTATAQFFASLPGAHRHSGEFFDQAPDANSVTLDVMGERSEGAALLSFPNHHTKGRSFWMIDSGGPRTYQRQMLPTLRSRGINRIDAVILSHGDVGHIGAVPEVLTHFRPGMMLEPQADNRSSAYPRIREVANSLSIPTHPLTAGQRIRTDQLETPVQFHVIAPDGSNEGRIADDRVLVMKMEVYDWTVLMTFDAGFETEKTLIQSGVNLKSDVWIRGQHLESPSGLARFVEAVDPKIVLSSNAGFPSSQRIPEIFREMLQQRSATLLTLDQSGVLTLEIKQDRLTVFSHQQRETVADLRNR
ncbi:MAG: ComEC/Rec2 family competence protein [Verrucomicrobiales bacterium]|nr:ComEC/Rec2 family competence protein [Verrucomicrobiales bacterium]